jgi:hypothetical protein
VDLLKGQNMTYLSSTAAAMTAAMAMTTAAIITTAATSYLDGESEVDARRYILVRGIDDHWRRIDAIPFVPISAERRRDGYSADH